MHRAIRRTLQLTLARGGSHTGDHMTQRVAGGVCPKDGTPFERRTVAGRTTFSCPQHPTLRSGRTIRACGFLVVEDESKMATLVRKALELEGYSVDVAMTGTDAVWMGTENEYDAIVLDVMIPEPDGFEVCRRLRADGRWAPILLLTARDSVDDRVIGLDAGADDYIPKPFSFEELYARLRALTRRAPPQRPHVLQIGDLELDPARHRVTPRRQRG